MIDAVQQARLTSALWECDRNRAALDEALRDWHSRPEPNEQSLELDSSLRRLTDQILYRFTKLQDAMRDRLDRLEKLGFLDVDALLQWREVRNRLAHEYPDQTALRHSAVLATVAAAQAMGSGYAGWKAKLAGD